MSHSEMLEWATLIIKPTRDLEVTLATFFALLAQNRLVNAESSGKITRTVHLAK